MSAISSINPPIVSAFGDTVWGDGAVLIISKNLPLKGKFFEMVSWGGLGGLAPPGISVTRALPPGGGSGGLRPSGISVNYPCLASAAAVPCPRALPPIFCRPIFSGIFFVRRRSVVRPTSVRPFVRRPSSVRRPSVRPWIRVPFAIGTLVARRDDAKHQCDGLA